MHLADIARVCARLLRPTAIPIRTRALSIAVVGLAGCSVEGPADGDAGVHASAPALFDAGAVGEPLSGDSGTSAVTSLAGLDAAAGSATPPLYALFSYIFNDSNATAYLTVLDSIEARADIDVARAREFAGWASPDAYGGDLYVASAEAPTLTRFSIDERGTLNGGQKLSFGSYTTGVVAFHFNHFIDPSNALITLENSTRVLWDPRGLTIKSELAPPPVQLIRDGMSLAAYSLSGAVRSDGLFQAYYWHDQDWFKFHPSSQIAIFNVPDGSTRSVLDVPCPALHRATSDEAGNLYFSTGGDIIAYQLLDEKAPKSCVVRINAGESTIASGWPKDFSTLTGGRRTGEFQYIKDGLGVLSVYHHERATIAANTDAKELIVANNWRMWFVEIDAWKARPIEGLDWLAGGTHVDTVDGRAFLFSSRSDFSRTTVYEILADGRVVRLFETPGYADEFVKVR